MQNLNKIFNTLDKTFGVRPNISVCRGRKSNTYSLTLCVVAKEFDIATLYAIVADTSWKSVVSHPAENSRYVQFRYYLEVENEDEIENENVEL